MDLIDASSYFDNDPVYDSYTGEFLFYAQIAAFDSARSEGAASKHHVLSTAADVTMPARAVVEFYGNSWLVGQNVPDGFAGEVARNAFSMKLCTDLMTLYSPGQLLVGAVGVQAWVSRSYLHTTSDAIESAEQDAFSSIFVAPGEPVAKGSFMQDASGRLYRVRNDYPDSSNLKICASDTLDTGALRSVVWNTLTLDAVHDTTTTSATTVNAIAFEPAKFYHFRHMSDPAVHKGDMAVFVPTTITPKSGDQFVMQGLSWIALTVQAELDCWAVHARLA